MTGVRVISCDIVKAANYRASGEKIELSPWDLRIILGGSIQKGLLFPKPISTLQEEETENTLIYRLKTSLSHALDYFPILAGRLATTEHENNTISFHVDCNNAGALYIHAAAAGVTISDIIKPVYNPPIIHSFFPLHGLKNCEGMTNPLLGVQITDLEDGIFIGCTMNHTVADGTSFWHFFNFWAEITNKGGSIHFSRCPVFQRWFPDGTHCPIRIPRSCLQQINEVILPPLEGRVFHFTKENIAKLKTKANAEIGTNNMISSLQALLSHTWKSVMRSKKCDLNEDTTFRLVVGARQRSQELPDNYFGNAISGVAVIMKAKELLQEGIGNVALQINKAIATMTEETFQKFLISWTVSPNFMTVGTLPRNTLATFSSPRFNMHGNNFGWGKPIAVKSGSANKFDGAITLFCGAEEGSIDAEISSSLETLEAMSNDKEFMDMVTV